MSAISRHAQLCADMYRLDGDDTIIVELHDRIMLLRARSEAGYAEATYGDADASTTAGAAGDIAHEAIALMDRLSRLRATRPFAAICQLEVARVVAAHRDLHRDSLSGVGPVTELISMALETLHCLTQYGSLGKGYDD